MTDKVGVFVDGGYLQKITEAFADKSNPTVTVLPQIDFGKLSDVLCPPSKGERFRTYYYDCPPFQSNPPSEDERKKVANQERFIHALNALPRFEVRLGRLNRITQKDGTFDYQQKG